MNPFIVVLLVLYFFILALFVGWAFKFARRKKDASTQPGKASLPQQQTDSIADSNSHQILTKKI